MLAEHLRRQLAAEVVVKPGLVLKVTVDPVEVKWDPPDTTLGECDRRPGNLRRVGPKSRSCATNIVTCVGITIVWSSALPVAA